MFLFISQNINIFSHFLIIKYINKNQNLQHIFLNQKIPVVVDEDEHSPRLSKAHKIRPRDPNFTCIMFLYTSTS